MRRITAQRLLESKTSVPHYYVTVDVRMDKLLALRAQLNKALEKDGAKLSVNDLIVKASALVRIVHGTLHSCLPTTGHPQDVFSPMNRCYSVAFDLLALNYLKQRARGTACGGRRCARCRA